MTLPPLVNEAVKQLLQWPPTTSTIGGAALLIFLGAFEAAGGFANYKAAVPAGIAAMALFAKICPQAAPEIDKVTATVQAAEDAADIIAKRA